MEQPNSNFVSQDLTPSTTTSQLQLNQGQSLLDQLGALDHQTTQIEAEGRLDVSGVGAIIDPRTVVTSSTQFQSDPRDLQGQLFTTVAVNATNTASNYDTSTYKEVLGKLNSLWSDQMREVENLTDDHWKNQEFPLARIKKIMRMDEEVKMISTEVPVMFSKILEIFITELTMRSWLHTEESKRRTVQRSDIGMAITKHDMFDFLIDIVPREEAQLKTKSQKEGGENLQLLPPDMLQVYIQQVINQTLASMSASGEEGEDIEVDSAVATNTLQQLQLLQQLVQLQHAQQEEQQQHQQQQQQQQQSTLGQLQHVNQPTSRGQYQTSGVDIEALRSSSGQVTVPLATSTVGSSLEQMTAATGQVTSSMDQTNQNISYGQQTLRHPQEFHQPQQHQRQPVFTSEQQSQITTVVIPPPLDSLVQPHQVQTVTSSMLDSPTTFQLQHHQTHNVQQGVALQNQLDSLTTEQFISQQISVELSNTRSREGDEGVLAREKRMNFQDIPEGESISRSLSPITGLPPNTDQLTEVVFPSEKHIDVHIIDDI